MVSRLEEEFPGFRRLKEGETVLAGDLFSAKPTYGARLVETTTSNVGRVVEEKNVNFYYRPLSQTKEKDPKLCDACGRHKDKANEGCSSIYWPWLSGKKLPTQHILDEDVVNHPKHYIKHPSGVECIQITEHFCNNLGNVIKYLWRAEEKGFLIQDLEKAEFYLKREITRRKKLAAN